MCDAEEFFIYLLDICICPLWYCFFKTFVYFFYLILVTFLFISMCSSWNNTNLFCILVKFIILLTCLLILLIVRFFNMKISWYFYHPFLIDISLSFLSSVAFMLGMFFPIHRSNVHIKCFLDILYSLFTCYGHHTGVYFDICAMHLNWIFRRS